MKDFAEALVQPELRGYVDTPVGLLRLGGRRSVITLVSSPWRFCVSDKPWLRHLVVARTRHSGPAAHQIHRIAAFLAEVYKHISLLPGFLREEGRRFISELEPSVFASPSLGLQALVLRHLIRRGFYHT